MNNCLICGNTTEYNLQYCINCIKINWKTSNRFIKRKHNPFYLPWAMTKFRSVVTADFITDKSLFINTIAENGEYYKDIKHNNICCVLHQPLGVVSGSAIPPNYKMPLYPLDSIYIADAISNPHVFAEDYSIISSKVLSSELIPIK